MNCEICTRSNFIHLCFPSLGTDHICHPIAIPKSAYSGVMMTPVRASKFPKALCSTIRGKLN